MQAVDWEAKYLALLEELSTLKAQLAAVETAARAFVFHREAQNLTGDAIDRAEELKQALSTHGAKPEAAVPQLRTPGTVEVCERCEAPQPGPCGSGMGDGTCHVRDAEMGKKTKEYKKCERCSGSGEVYDRHPQGSASDWRCPICNGAGRVEKESITRPQGVSAWPSLVMLSRLTKRTTARIGNFNLICRSHASKDFGRITSNVRSVGATASRKPRYA